MANPNIAGLSSILGVTEILIPSTTSLTQLGTTAAANHVLRVNSLVVANVTATAATITVGIYPNTTPTGTPIRLAYQISIPGNASLIVVDKTSQIYLGESQCIGVTSGTSASLECTISYENIS